MILDQTQDLNGQELFRMVTLYGAPDYVKSAQVTELCGDELPQAQFADPLHRSYPLHTQAATWASAAFYLEKEGADLKSSAWHRIQESVKYFKIDADIEQLHKKIAAATTVDETQLPDSAFGLVTREGDQVRRQYPLRNAMEVKTAAAYLVAYRDRFPLPICRQFAERILDKAAAFSAGLREFPQLEKLAGNGISDAATLSSAIRTRVLGVGPARHDPACQEMEKLASEIDAHPQQTCHASFLIGLADAIDTFDRQYGLNHQYSQGLPRPEDIAFGITKQAMAAVTDELVDNTLTGTVYKRADLEQLQLRDVADALGEEVAGDVSLTGRLDTHKLAAALPTLPLGDAEVFDALAAEAGIAPFAVKRASGITKNPLPAASSPAARRGGLWEQISAN